MQISVSYNIFSHIYMQQDVIFYNSTGITVHLYFSLNLSYLILQNIITMGIQHCDEYLFQPIR